MATFLFDKIIFGPIKSRRLGISLGINLLPTDLKFCTFDCIYCECGWTFKDQFNKIKLHSKEEIHTALENELKKMNSENKALDNITFAGNGEPTTHPDFSIIIDETIASRNKYFPKAKISVLSNATQLHKNNIVETLKKVDQNILKLDTVDNDLFNLINRPQGNLTVEKVIHNLKKFEGNLIIQTMFLRGEIDGIHFDNSKMEYVKEWIKVLVEINPKNVMIYPIDRDTPAKNLEKISKDELTLIADLVKNAGINVQVY